MGGLAHEDYRSFNNDRRTHPQKAFIDGDLVERLLDMSPADQCSAIHYLNDEITNTLTATTAASGNKPKPNGPTTAAAAAASASSGRVADTNKANNDFLSHLTAGETSIFNPSHTALHSLESVLHRVEDFARLH